MMKIITIESSAYSMLMARFNDFLTQAKLVCKHSKKMHMDDWLDTEDVCTLLSISTRTLQNYRSRGAIGFSKKNKKMYYKGKDIQKFIDERKK